MKFVYLILTFISIAECFGYDYMVTLFKQNGSSSIVIYKRCGAAGALFGPTLNDDELIGCPVFTIPQNGCSTIQPASFNRSSTGFTCFQYLALIQRGNCTYAKKALLAQEAGYQGVIIYDNEMRSNLQPMAGDGIYDSKINIAAVMITRACGLYLKNFSFEEGYDILISRINMDFARYMMPFAIVISVVFFLATIFLIMKIIREKRHEWRRRLSRQKLKRIPTKKYKKNDIPETCPICLDDFDEGEKLRILPCSHWYHGKCVDPWLTKNRKICPVCKRKVVKDDSDSSSADDTRPGPASGRSAATGPAHAAGIPGVVRGHVIDDDDDYDEQTPLIGGAGGPPEPGSPSSRHQYGSIVSSYGSGDFDSVSTLQNITTDGTGTSTEVQHTDSTTALVSNSLSNRKNLASSASANNLVTCEEKVKEETVSSEINAAFENEDEAWKAGFKPGSFP